MLSKKHRNFLKSSLKSVTQNCGSGGFEGPLGISSPASCSNWANTTPCFPKVTVNNYCFSHSMLFTCASYCFHIFSPSTSRATNKNAAGKVLRCGKCWESQHLSHATGHLGREEWEWVQKRGDSNCSGGAGRSQWFASPRVQALECLSTSNGIWLAFTNSKI